MPRKRMPLQKGGGMKIELTAEEFERIFGILSHEELVKIAREVILSNKRGRGRPKK